MKLLLFFLGSFLTLSGNDAPLSLGVSEVRINDSPNVIARVKIGPVVQGSCDGWRWGAENECPKLALISLEVTVGDGSLFVPRSAFADLGTPHSAVLRKHGAEYELTIKGGDAATSYQAQIRFSRSQIRSRTVSSGEFPDSARERTTFSFPN